MAHSNHARHARYQDHAAWFQKNVKHDSPAWDERRADLRVIESGLDEVALAVHDPEVLLWGGALVTVKDVNRREKLREKFDSIWSQADYYRCQEDDYYDPYWEGRDLYDYQDSYDDYDYSDDRYYERYLDPCDAAWVAEWVDGREQTPDDWSDRSREFFLDDYAEDCDWEWENAYEYDLRMSRLESLPADLSEVRAGERKKASTRGRRRSARTR